MQSLCRAGDARNRIKNCCFKTYDFETCESDRIAIHTVRGAVKGGKVRTILRAHDGRGPPEGET